MYYVMYQYNIAGPFRNILVSWFQQLMKRPDEKVIPKLQRSFQDFILNHGLGDLMPLFKALLHNNGYGPIYDLPAIYGLIWCTPNMIVDIIALKGKQLQKGSIADLFPLMVKEQNVSVVFNFEVTVSKFIPNKYELASSVNSYSL